MKTRTICLAAVLTAGGFLGFAGPIAALTPQSAALSSAADATAVVDNVRVVVRGRGAVVRGPRGGVGYNRTVVRGRGVVGGRGFVGGRGVVVRGGGYGRPYRAWVRRPYYGTVIAGVALGTLIVASTVPVAPAPNLCWYWADGGYSRGYWDYC